MSGNCLNFEEPIKDAISRVQFAPESNNLLFSSWDSSIRLVDVNSGKLRLEAQTEAAVLDCCFENESVAFSAASDGSIFRYDLQSGAYAVIGQHEDSATCIDYSPETSKVITAGWDGKVLSWDSRSAEASQDLVDSNLHVESLSVCGVEVLMSTGSSVHKYDLRKLDGAIQDLSMGFWIRCVRSMTSPKGFAVGSVDGHVTLQSNSDEMGYTFAVSQNLRKERSSCNSERYCLQSILPRYPNSVASLSYNHTGELLAVASSYTYQESNELEDHPQIYIQKLGESHLKCASSGSSCRR